MTVIDARGMRCPWPAIRLARALRDGADTVTIIADDPAAPAELAAVARAAGATIEAGEAATPNEFRVLRGRSVNGSFTPPA